MQRLYGSAIFEPCPTADFVAWWTQSLRDSPAKTSPSPARALGSMGAAPACSSTSSTPPTLAVRGASLWRTSLASLLPPPPLWTKPKALSKSERPPESWENWPTAGGMRNGSLFQRPTWAPRMGGNDGSASRGDGWMTPDVPNGGRKLDAETIARKGTRADGTKAQVGLENQTRMWMTPKAKTATDQEYTRDGGVKGKERLTLAGQATARQAPWPTPSQRDGDPRRAPTHPESDAWKNKVARGSVNSAGMLSDDLSSLAASWPTPTSSNGGANSNRDERGNVGADLKEASQQWPTPRATTRAGDSGSAQRQEQGPNPGLYDMARNWPTPASRDYRSPNAESYEDRGGGTKGEQLQNFVEHRFSSLQAPPIPDGLPSSPTTRTSPLRLNPLFGAWLMGWPSTWTIAEPHASSALATESFRRALDSLLRSSLGARGSS